METFKTVAEATTAAIIFFEQNFDYQSGVGYEKRPENVLEFYSKDDPAMDDTFTCKIDADA